MKRNGLSKAIKLVLVGTLAGGLAACGGGGSGSSGSVGASGNAEGTSVGAVTGFGSVYVNGTRFATDGSVSSDDGIEREGQLEKGMVLKIKGGWDERGQGQARGRTTQTLELPPLFFSFCLLFWGCPLPSSHARPPT